MEEQHREKLVKRASFYTNLAFILGDVVNTYTMEALDCLSKLGQDFRMRDKQRLKIAVEALKVAKKRTAEFVAPLYEIKESDNACRDSDFFCELIELVADRTGNTETSEEAMLKRIKKLTSKNGIIK